MTRATDATENALAKALTLLEQVDFDNNGIMIGNQRVGGNGGTMSLDTVKAADQLRLAFDRLKQEQEAL